VLDGVEALRLADSADLLLLDLEMPRMDGFAVLERLQGQAAAPLVIVITAHGDMSKAFARCVPAPTTSSPSRSTRRRSSWWCGVRSKPAA
jgi:CheY-like chemotaxis protein